MPYLKRRSRRILPPYYAALVLSVIALGLIPGLRQDDSGNGSLYHAGVMPAAIASHLLMVHNLQADWTFRINGPLWSVATEYQIYFLFPLVLLPLCRRFGAAAAVVVGFTMGLATIPLGLEDACFWYIGLFAIGMGAAVAAVSPSAIERAKPSPWMLLALTYACVAWMASLCDNYIGQLNVMVVSDLLVGLGTGSLLIGCATSLRTIHIRTSPVLSVLTTPILVRLGHFSYSLYLTHIPIVLAVQLGVNVLDLSISTRFLLLIAISVPLSLAAAYGFHLVFERPFMNSPARPAYALAANLASCATIDAGRVSEPRLA